jgi:hypothetical protein
MAAVMKMPNVAADMLAPLFYMREAPGSDFGSVTGLPDWRFRGFLQFQ